MDQELRKLGKSFLHSNSLVFTFARSSLSSQMCGWLDFAVSFVMFAWVGMKPVYSAAVGALVGGIANAIVNYKFTYQAKDCSWRAVGVKFFLVWAGSLSLNSFGTEGVYWVLNQWHWLERIGFRPDGYFTAARLLVSLLVSIAWNFMLQRNFVYKPVKFDKTAIRISYFLFPSRHKKNNKEV